MIALALQSGSMRLGKDGGHLICLQIGDEAVRLPLCGNAQDFLALRHCQRLTARNEGEEAAQCRQPAVTRIYGRFSLLLDVLEKGKHLDTRQVMEADRADTIREAVRETDRLYAVWDAVRDSRCEFYYVTVRRQALKKLQEMVGPEAYAAGDLPPYVPEWRFAEIK